MRKFRLIFALLSLSFAFPGASWAAEDWGAPKRPAPLAAPTGATIFFKAAGRKSDRDGLHRALGTKRVFRGKNLDLDAVELPTPFVTSEDTIARLCELYLKSPIVQDCEASRNLVFNTRDNKPDKHDSDSWFRDFSTATKGKAVSKAACQRLPADFKDEAERPWLNGLPGDWHLTLTGRHLVNQRKTKPKEPARFAIIDGSFSPEDLDPTLLTEQAAEIAKGKAGEKLKTVGERQQSAHGSIALQAGLGKPPYGGGQGRARVAFLAAAPKNYMVEDALPDLLAAKPEVTNLSIGAFPNVPRLQEPLKQLMKESAVVFGLGNSFPAPADPLAEDENSVLVGAYSPNGTPYYGNNSTRKKLILAPSDSYLMTRTEGESYRTGGTSFAAPQVAGVIADVVSLLPPSDKFRPARLTGKQANLLLQSTAIQAPIGSLLNAYKAFRVGERLGEKKWPEGDDERVKLLSDEALYDFTEEAEKALLAAKKKAEAIEFPDEIPEKGLDRAKCKEMDEAINAYLEAFFLASGSSKAENAKKNQKVAAEAAEALMKLFGQLELAPMVRFFQSLTPKGLAKTVDEVLGGNLTEAPVNLKLSAVRATPFLEEKDRLKAWERLTKPGAPPVGAEYTLYSALFSSAPDKQKGIEAAMKRLGGIPPDYARAVGATLASAPARERAATSAEFGELLRSDNDNARLFAITTIQTMADRLGRPPPRDLAKLIPDLVKALDSEKLLVESAKALSLLDTREGQKGLAAVLEKAEGADARRALLTLLAKASDREKPGEAPAKDPNPSVTAVKKALKDEDLRLTALYALTDLGTSGMELLKSELARTEDLEKLDDQEVRAFAVVISGFWQNLYPVDELGETAAEFLEKNKDRITKILKRGDGYRAYSDDHVDRLIKALRATK